MQEGQIPQQHPGHAAPTATGMSLRYPPGGGDSAIDTGETPVGKGCDVFPRSNPVHLPDHPRCPQHQSVVGPGCFPHGKREAWPGNGLAKNLHFRARKSTAHRLVIGFQGR